MNSQKLYVNDDESSVLSTINEIDFSATYSYADYMRFAFEERMEKLCKFS